MSEKYASVLFKKVICLILLSFFYISSPVGWLGIERLLLLLGEKASSSNPSEVAACERVQQKAAVTLARLSRDPDVAQTAIQLKGYITQHYSSLKKN